MKRTRCDIDSKYSITDTGGNDRIYIGPFTLARKDYGQNSSGNNGNNNGNPTSQYITLLESAEALGSDARFAFSSTPQNTSGTDTTYTVAYETLYILKDHLGSIRTITDSQGNTLERNDYYPYGLQTDLGRNYTTLPDKYRVRMPATFTSGNPNINNQSLSSPSGKQLPYRLLYNGKELQMIAQTRFIDYGARQYDPTIARWNGMDPMAEDIFQVSAFLYCNGNPIYYIDLKGLDFYGYTDAEGNVHAQWLNSQDDLFTDEEGRQWQNIGENFLSIGRESATLYTQTQNKDGSLTLKQSAYNLNNPDEINSLYSDINKVLNTASEIVGFAGNIMGSSKKTFRLFDSFGNLNCRIYSNGWKGNQYVRTKSFSFVGKRLQKISNVFSIASSSFSLSQISQSNTTLENIGHGLDAALSIGSTRSSYIFFFDLYYQLVMKNYPEISKNVNKQIVERANSIQKGYPAVGHPGFPSF